ncbi:MAG: hypothetical protein ACK5L5_07230 [Bacteroidales bacterium]
MYLLSILCLISCKQENENWSSNTDLNNEIVILKERETPWIPSDFKSKLKSAQLSTKGYAGLAHRNFLGYSLKNDVYPLEDTRNLGYQVIDLEKLYEDYPNYVRSWKNNTGEATYFSYATFD